MALCLQFLQDGIQIDIHCGGNGDYVVKFCCLEDFQEFRRCFDSRLLFSNDDARFVWSPADFMFEIDWFL